MTVLEAIGLAKFYGSVPAVREVTFRLGPGQVLGYLGPNGSGKSTTVKVLTGLLQPSHGQVLFEGRDIQSDLVTYRKRLGYVPEKANTYPFVTGTEYLEMIGTLRGMSPTRMKIKIGSLLELFSLFPHRHVSLGSYSKGMRQRILLIAALMDNPDVLILDEPLSGLDVTSVLIFKNLIQAFSARGKAVFYCSHILEVLEKVCSQLLILRKGQVIAYGSTEEVRQRIGQSSLERIFLQLVEDTDVTQVANEIVDIVVAPSWVLGSGPSLHAGSFSRNALHCICCACSPAACSTATENSALTIWTLAWVWCSFSWPCRECWSLSSCFRSLVRSFVSCGVTAYSIPMSPPFQTNISSSCCRWPLAALRRCGGGTPFFRTAAITRISCPSPSR